MKSHKKRLSLYGLFLIVAAAWSLSSTAALCAPSLDYDSDVIIDCGNADGVSDPGETTELNVTAQNTGDADALNIQGVLSTTTPGITVTTSTVAFPDISVGLTGTSLTTFQFLVDSSVPCGTAIDFTLDFTYADGLGNLLSNSTSPPSPVQVGQFTQFLLTTFDDCADPPTSNLGNWLVINGGSKIGWTRAGSGCPADCVRGLFPTNYYICDSDCPGGATTHNEELISPVIDTSAATTVTLQFDSDYYNYAEPTSSDVNVRSSLTGGAWVTLRDFSEGCSLEGDCAAAGTGTFVLDATAQCAGAADCQFEFHQVATYYTSWWWAVDNVMVTEPLVCNPAACPPSLLALTPPMGPSSGGNEVRIYGNSFDPACTVTFGGAPQPFTHDSSSIIRVIAPPDVQQSVEVRVTNPDSQFAVADYVYCDTLTGSEAEVPNLMLSLNASNEVVLDWDPVVNADEYAVLRSPNPGLAQSQEIGTVLPGVTTFTDAEAGRVSRYYQVLARVLGVSNCP
ncbi:MAG: IPT/TIG domain-containing protein [Acidobacteriota bacterium]|nr:MAG: IPT/TIG domain-containing protein [Acidobacteriota bacterium]